MQQVPIPPEAIPPGGQLSPTGMSYADAWDLPVVNAPPAEGNGGPQVLTVVRANMLFQMSNDEVKQMAGNGWRFWLRMGPSMPGGALMLLEPLSLLAYPNLPLNSDLTDRPEGP